MTALTEKATLRLPEVAELLCCDVKVVYALAASGSLPGAKIGKAWVFKRGDVQAYLDAEIARQTEARSTKKKEELRAQLARSVAYVGFGKKRGRPRTPVFMTVELSNVGEKEG